MFVTRDRDYVGSVRIDTVMMTDSSSVNGVPGEEEVRNFDQVLVLISQEKSETIFENVKSSQTCVKTLVLSTSIYRSRTSVTYPRKEHKNLIKSPISSLSDTLLMPEEPFIMTLVHVVDLYS